MQETRVSKKRRNVRLEINSLLNKEEFKDFIDNFVSYTMKYYNPKGYTKNEVKSRAIIFSTHNKWKDMIDWIKELDKKMNTNIYDRSRDRRLSVTPYCDKPQQTIDVWATQEIETWSKNHWEESIERFGSEKILRIISTMFDSKTPKANELLQFIKDNPAIAVLLRRLIDQNYNKRYTEKSKYNKVN